MTLNATLLPEFDQEMATARRVLANVPTDKLAWKPHEKSMTMGHLASHIADMLKWTVSIVDAPMFDIAPPGEEPRKMFEASSSEELLKTFDENVAQARAAISGASDEIMMRTWTFKMGGKELMSMPTIASIRGFVFNHIIHHRGQLSVYLRLNDIPVPSIYGPSADDSGGF